MPPDCPRSIRHRFPVIGASTTPRPSMPNSAREIMPNNSESDNFVGMSERYEVDTGARTTIEWIGGFASDVVLPRL
jgi:hypothetical protein